MNTSPQDTYNKILTLLREALGPNELQLRDDSPRHTSHKKAHPEASTPGGHYSLFIVSESFQGLSRLDRERSVVEILRPLFNTNEIHALQMTLRAPSEIT